MIDLVQCKNFLKSEYSKVTEVEILRPSTVKSLMKQLSQSRGLTIVEPLNNEVLRAAFENKNVDIVLSPEKYKNFDYMHQRNSGLNHILCNLARKNKIAVGISFSDLLNEKDLSRRLGRIMQNVRICRKYKVKMVLASFAKDSYEMRSPKDLLAFARVIGMTPLQAKEALDFKKEEKSFVKEIKTFINP